MLAGYMCISIVSDDAATVALPLAPSASPWGCRIDRVEMLEMVHLTKTVLAAIRQGAEVASLFRQIRPSCIAYSSASAYVQSGIS